MHMRWEHIREPMERQRGLMGDDAGPIGPEPGDDQLFVLARWEVDEAVNAPACPCDATRTDVLEQQLRREADLSSLPGGEVAFLGASCLKKDIPAWFLGRYIHARIVTRGLVLCKRLVVVTFFETQGLVLSVWSSIPSQSGTDAPLTRPWKPTRSFNGSGDKMG